MSVPRTQMQSMNGKRPCIQRAQETHHLPSQHEDLIRYIYDSWSKISREFVNFNQNGRENGGPCVLYYSENEPNPKMKDFRPFNLDAFWGQRVVQNITRTQPSS